MSSRWRSAGAVLAALLALAVAAPSLWASSSAVRGSCSRHTAYKLIRTLPVGSSAKPYQKLDQVLCIDFDKDGRRDMVVSVWVAMNHGAHYWAAFRHTASSWTRVAYSGDCCKSSAKKAGLGISVRRHGKYEFVIKQPIYKPTDPACCPSGGTKSARWAWKRGRLRVVAHS